MNSFTAVLYTFKWIFYKTYTAALVHSRLLALHGLYIFFYFQRYIY